MTEANKIQLVKRLKSFLWRSLCVFLMALITFVSDVLGLFELPLWIATLIGLVLAEITKLVNNNTNLFGGRLK